MSKPAPLKRIKPKEFPMVEVLLPAVYGDVPLIVPDMNSFDQRTQLALTSGGARALPALYEMFEEAGVESVYIDAILDLQGQDTTDFMKAWAKASSVSLGK